MSDFKTQFGLRLKELRKQKKLSQEIFAEMIGITPRNLSKIETGQTFPSSSSLEKIIYSLKCEPSELFKFVPLSDFEVKQCLKNKIDNLDQKKLLYVYKFVESIE